MKKYFYFMSMVAIVAAMAACNKGGGEEIPTEEPIEPAKITIAEAFQEFYMNKGESIKLSYTVAPSGINVDYTLNWESDDPDVAIVVNDEVQAVGLGTTEITVNIPEYPDVKKAKFTVTVLDPIEVGDFLYSDGSWGNQKVVTGKSIIGLVYWLGNPTLFDPILESDYPNCTHGLAMSLKQGKAEHWQKDFMEYWFNGATQLEYDKMKDSPLCNNSGSLTEWGFYKSSYSDLLAPYLDLSGAGKDLWAGGGMYCGIGGYTYTAILEEFTKTDPAAVTYPYEFYNNAMDLVKDIETPLSTSRWYVPSIFEAALMVNTALTKPSDFNNTDKGGDGAAIINHNNSNVSKLNSVLNSISGADPLPTDKSYAIASATDAFMPFDSIVGAMGIPCAEFFECMAITQDSVGYAEKEASYNKAVADGKTEDAEYYKKEMDKLLANETRWYDWLKANAGDQYSTYESYKTTEERVEIYAQIKNMDITYSQLGGAGLIFALSLFGTLTYANVGVADGLLHNNIFVSTGDPVSGGKGSDNTNDVVRAIIAF